MGRNESAFLQQGFHSAGCRELVYPVAVSQFAAIDFGCGGTRPLWGNFGVLHFRELLASECGADHSGQAKVDDKNLQKILHLEEQCSILRSLDLASCSPSRANYERAAAPPHSRLR